MVQAIYDPQALGRARAPLGTTPTSIALAPLGTVQYKAIQDTELLKSHGFSV